MSFTGLISPLIRRKKGDEFVRRSRSIERHQRVILHCEEAIRLHTEAIGYLELSDREKATKNTLKAHEHTALAIEAQKKELELQAPG